jgi:hypothetical protein
MVGPPLRFSDQPLGCSRMMSITIPVSASAANSSSKKCVRYSCVSCFSTGDNCPGHAIEPFRASVIDVTEQHQVFVPTGPSDTLSEPLPVLGRYPNDVVGYAARPVPRESGERKFLPVVVTPLSVPQLAFRLGVQSALVRR